MYRAITQYIHQWIKPAWCGWRKSQSRDVQDVPACCHLNVIWLTSWSDTFDLVSYKQQGHCCAAVDHVHCWSCAHPIVATYCTDKNQLQLVVRRHRQLLNTVPTPAHTLQVQNAHMRGCDAIMLQHPLHMSPADLAGRSCRYPHWRYRHRLALQHHNKEIDWLPVSR